MKLAKLSHDPMALIDYFQEGLETLGAVCERTWHDRLQVIAEGRAARLWDSAGGFVETEVHFAPPGDSAPRDARSEVFPGCPLTFHLAEALQSPTLLLQRAIFEPVENAKPPMPDVVEKLWHAQIRGTTHWKLENIFQTAWHFSLLILARCEIQAIDQHWSLHRIAISYPDGQCDESLAANLDFSQLSGDLPVAVAWPPLDALHCQHLIHRAISEQVESDLVAIRLRQQNYLCRELERIDDYFRNYEHELATRNKRQQRGKSKFNGDERLAAAKAEHERRRIDQVQRHEIRVIPHLDAFLLLAEPAWSARVITRLNKNELQTVRALFVPRARRWVLLDQPWPGTSS